MLEKIILKLAYKILAKNGGKKLVNGVYLIRMSRDFYEWTYKENYNAYCLKESDNLG